MASKRWAVAIWRAAVVLVCLWGLVSGCSDSKSQKDDEVPSGDAADDEGGSKDTDEPEADAPPGDDADEESAEEVFPDDIADADALESDGPLEDLPEGEADGIPDANADRSEAEETPPEPEVLDEFSDADLGDEGETDGGPLTAATCLADLLPESGVPNVDYDQFGPVIGSHCKGTNHQDIRNVQRVVFVGDSITTGTPPTLTAEWYRNIVADELAARFGLEAPGYQWKAVNLLEGISYEMHSGDFWTCAKHGARVDDITDPPHQQLLTCNPEAERSKTTLVIMTMGGNDIFKWAQDLVDGVSVEDIWLKVEKAVQDLEDSIHWAVDPANFPNGVYVVFANTYEFTDEDSGNDLATCPGAGIIAMDWALVDPRFIEMSTYFTTEYMRIAVETGTDMVFWGEANCGHGHMRDNPEGRCYRGPGTELWFDISCMHPSAAGHAGLADLFLSVVDE